MNGAAGLKFQVVLTSVAYLVICGGGSLKSSVTNLKGSRVILSFGCDIVVNVLFSITSAQNLSICPHFLSFNWIKY